MIIYLLVTIDHYDMKQTSKLTIRISGRNGHNQNVLTHPHRYITVGAKWNYTYQFSSTVSISVLSVVVACHSLQYAIDLV